MLEKLKEKRINKTSWQNYSKNTSDTTTIQTTLPKIIKVYRKIIKLY